MKLLAWILASLAVATAHLHTDPTLDNHWELWKKAHGKQYSTKNEDMKRRMIWERNFRLISLHNLEENLGLHSYTMGMNQFADLTSEEMAVFHSGVRIPNQPDWNSRYWPPPSSKR